MSIFQIDDTWRQDFAVQDPATGAAVDADSDPDVEIYEDGGSAPITTISAQLRDVGTTGQYTVSVDLTVANGFDSGKTYNVYAVAVVGGVTGKAVISTFRIKPLLTYVN